MAANSSIEWCGPTWNPVAAYHVDTGIRGWFCTHAHEGCRFCYAERINKRLGNGLAYTAQNRDKVRWESINLGLPFRWMKPQNIFVDSMFDLFEPSMPRTIQYRVFVAMAIAWRHMFLVLTKHPDNLRIFTERFNWKDAIEACRDENGVSAIPRHSINDLERLFGLCQRFSYDRDCTTWPIPNVMFGTSPCDQTTADKSVPELLRVPAAGRFLSIEPMIGPIELRPQWLPGDLGCESCDATCRDCPLNEAVFHSEEIGPLDKDGAPTALNTKRATLHWVIAGGESGPGARPTHPDWLRGIRDQCQAVGVPFFFKQWGNHVPGDLSGEDERGRPAYILDTEHCTVDYDVLGRGTEVTAHGATFIRFPHKKGGRLLDGRTWDEMPPMAVPQ